MRLWVDDLRTPPDAGWAWAQTSAAALWHLDNWVNRNWARNAQVDEELILSLDHDLGGDDTTRPVMLWLIENVKSRVDQVSVHTANPVGREWLEGMRERYLK